MISLSPEEGGQHLRCDTEGNGTGYRDNNPNDWEEVTECEDGLDNDADDEVDLEDPGCGNNPSTESEGGGVCPPTVGYSNGEKKAFYNTQSDGDYSPDGDSCNYESVDEEPEYTGQEPEKFECLESDTAPGGVTLQNYDGPTTGEAVKFCADRLSATGGFSQNPMPAVQYYVPEDAMQTGSRWADENGYESNSQFRTIEIARGPVVEENYENATGRTNPEILSSGDTLNEQGVFPGGFYGDCSGGQQWQYTPDGWACSGEIQWTQSVVVPEYIAEDDAAQTVGIYLLPYNFQSGNTLDLMDVEVPGEYSFTSAYKSSDKEENADLQSLSAACWVGNQDSKPEFQSSNEGVEWFQTRVTGLDSGIESPVPVYGNLNLSSGQKYTCKWGYTLTSGEFYDDIGGSPSIITESSDLPLQQGWFGTGFPRDDFNGRFKSGDAKSQFESWTSSNSGTGRESEAKCGELGLSC